MRILLCLVGVVLAGAFLLYMAIRLDYAALYVVCIGGIVLMVVAFWRDEIRPAVRSTQDDYQR